MLDGECWVLTSGGEGRGICHQTHAEFGRLAAKVLEFGCSIFSFVMFHPLVDILGPILEHSVNEDRMPKAITAMARKPIDQGSKDVLGKSSQENKILTDCCTVVTVELLQFGKFLLTPP